MHRCLKCDEELNFVCGRDPQVCDACLLYFHRYESYEVQRRSLRERFQYHEQRRKEEEEEE